MLQTPPRDAAPDSEERHDAAALVPAPANAEATTPIAAPAEKPKGCLFAISQPPLMIFLTVIGTLLLLASLHDLLLL